MKAPFLYGEHDLVLDTKNRLSMPAETRRSIDTELYGKSLFVIVGKNKKPWIYPELYYKEIATQLPPGISPDDTLLKYAHLKYSGAALVEWDPQGRMVMPPKILARTGTGREVTLIGVVDHLEIWNRQEWATHQKALEEQSDVIEANARVIFKELGIKS